MQDKLAIVLQLYKALISHVYKTLRIIHMCMYPLDFTSRYVMNADIY